MYIQRERGKGERKGEGERGRRQREGGWRREDRRGRDVGGREGG